MIDYIKAYFADKDTVFKHIHGAYKMDSNCYERFDIKKKEVVQYQTYFKSFHNLFVKISNKLGFLENSLHVLYNNLKQPDSNRNHNDFTYSNLLESLDFVKDLTDYPLEKMMLSQGLEFGFNLEVPFEVDDFIVKDCLMFDFKPHSFLEHSEEKTLKEFTHGFYKLKIYNKAKQFSLPNPILRIELKFLDKRGFNNLGIFSIKDLSDQTNLYTIFKLMMYLISKHLLVVDNVENRGFSDYKHRKIHRFCSFKFWHELPHFQLKSSKVNCYRTLEKYKLMENKKLLLSLMESKFYELINN